MKDGTYKWLVVAMLWIICLFNYSDRQAIASVFPLLQSEFGLTNLALGWMVSSFMWVYAGAGWIAGVTGDRFHRKSVIIGGLVFWSVITFLIGYSTQYWQLVTLRSLQGLGEAFYFPAAMSLLSDYHGKETRSRAMGIHQSAVYAGTVVGGSLAGWLAQGQGWRFPFLLFGGCGVVLGIFLIFTLKEPRRGQSETGPAAQVVPPISFRQTFSIIWSLYQIPMVRILTMVFFGANFVAIIFLSWLPKYLFDQFKMSLAMSGFSATVYLQVGSIVGTLAGGILADRWVRRHPGGRMLSQSLGLFLGVPFLFLLGWTMNVPGLVMAMGFYGICKGVYDANIWTSLHDVVRPEHRATGVGVMNSLAWLGGGLGTVSIAWASQYFGMSTCLSATCMIYLLIGVLLVWGVRKYMRPEQTIS